MPEKSFNEAKSALAFSQNLVDRLRQAEKPVVEQPEEKMVGETMLGGVDVDGVGAPTKLTQKPFQKLVSFMATRAGKMAEKSN